jgi:alcohol dehydrogenase class IV
VPAEEARRRFIDALCDLRQSSGIMGTLGSHQLSACDVGPIAERAFNDPCTITNPRRPNVRDLATICEEAL